MTDEIKKAIESIDSAAEAALNPPPVERKPTAEDDIKELGRAMLIAGVLAIIIRSFLFEPFNIPSGSMFPTLRVGDYLFVEKYAYGYSRYSLPLGLPLFKGRIMEKQVTRGDVAVFRQPMQPNIDYIKRIVGLPGDKIEVREGLLYINDEPVTREYKGNEEMADGGISNRYLKYIETLPNGVKHAIYEVSDTEQYDNTETYTVPEGYYFAMGDNRDASQDSRVQYAVGFVPAENMVGRASFIFFSVGSIGNTCDREGTFAALREIGCKLVEWPKVIRYNRIFKSVSKI